MYCPSCGAQNVAEGRFCQVCGKELPRLQAAPTKNPPTLPAWPTADQPYHPSSVVTARTAMPVQADPTTPPALIVAAIIYFLLAFGALIPGALAFSIAINST